MKLHMHGSVHVRTPCHVIILNPGSRNSNQYAIIGIKNSNQYAKHVMSRMHKADMHNIENRFCISLTSDLAGEL